MKKLITKADQFLVKNYKTILLDYILYLITFFWLQLYWNFTKWGGFQYYEIIFVTSGFDIGLDQDISSFILNALPLLGLIAWKKIFHPND